MKKSIIKVKFLENCIVEMASFVYRSLQNATLQALNFKVRQIPLILKGLVLSEIVAL